MGDVQVIGAAMTRFGKFMDRSVRSLAEEAVRDALDDASVPPGEVDIAFFSNAVAGVLTGQEMIRGQVALRHTGLLGIPIVNVENACASASTAFYLAWMAVASGTAEVALAVGAEKLTHPDKARSFAAIGTAVDLEQLGDLERQMAHRAGGGSPGEAGGGRSFFMDVYASTTQAYMERGGATAEDFAQVSVKNHHHGALNPKAQYREEVTLEQVLGGRRIAGPLTLLMCSPIGDGAAALVLCSEERARRLDAEPVRVRSTVLVSGRDRESEDPPAVERAAALAYERAGTGPQDLDVLEVHDAAAPAELILYEELGLCAAGDGPKLLASGDTALGGRMPVNPSGGLLSKGHPIGATGCGQLVELVDQLRGRCGDRQVAGARTALAENGGGFLGNDPAATVVTIVSRYPPESRACGRSARTSGGRDGVQASRRHATHHPVLQAVEAGGASEDPGDARGGQPVLTLDQRRLPQGGRGQPGRPPDGDSGRPSQPDHHRRPRPRTHLHLLVHGPELRGPSPGQPQGTGPPGCADGEPRLVGGLRRRRRLCPGAEAAACRRRRERLDGRDRDRHRNLQRPERRG